MWFCARCGARKPSPLSECATCAASETVRSAAGGAPKRCWKCGGELPGPSVLGRLSCPACGIEFGDYAAWVEQCRAAAYAAHPAPSHVPPFQPGPPPAHLRFMTIGFLAAAPLQLLGAWAAPDLLLPCLVLALLQLAAGVLLLKRLPGARSTARLTAGLSTLVPVFLLPGFFFLWAFHAFTTPASLAHFGPLPGPADRRAKRIASTAFFVFLAGFGAMLWLQSAARASAVDWQDLGSPFMAASGAVLDFHQRNSMWLDVGAALGLVVAFILAHSDRKAFAWATALALAPLTALAAWLGVGAAVYRRDVARAELVQRESELPRLLWALKDPEPKTRMAAAWRLSELGRGALTAVPALEKALEDRDPRVRTLSALALAGIQPRADLAVDVLHEALRDPRAERAVLARALLQYGPRARRALPGLLAALSTTPEVVPVLAEIGAPAVPGLVDALKHPEAEVRRRALEALRGIGPDARGAAGAVEAAVKDVDPKVAAEAVRACGEILREKAAPSLHALLRGESPLKSAAAEALCALGEREGLSGLPAPGNHLNAVRRPAQWDHLRRLTIDQDLDGTNGEILDDLAVQAVMCVEPSAGLRLTEPRRIHGSARKRSALDVLRSLDLPFVLEEDRIRILRPEEAKDFWTKWLYEARAERSR